MPILEVRNLSMSYGPIKALSDLSFDVEEGEIFGILGPNGAGKTTAVEGILGTRRMDCGTVGILGKNPTRERRSIFRQVGVQFQDSGWPTGIRVGEACEAAACVYDPRPEWRSRLADFGLEKRIDAPVEKCSGGERQKLAILLACIHEPRLVFLDELTTGLDPLARRDTWDMILAMRENGTSVVLTSHFMDEVEALCENVLLLVNGRKTAEGSVEELIESGGGETLDEAYVNLVRGLG